MAEIVFALEFDLVAARVSVSSPGLSGPRVPDYPALRLLFFSAAAQPKPAFFPDVEGRREFRGSGRRTEGPCTTYVC